MYYKPKHFCVEEWFSRKVVEEYTISKSRRKRIVEDKIWRLLDFRIVWTKDKIREHFDCAFYMNDWRWGGHNHHRGYRSFEELLDPAELKLGKIKSTLSTLTSQHCFGRGGDSKAEGIAPQEIIEDIKKHPNCERYKYITAVETGVSWLHLDMRNWDKARYGIFFFQP